MTFCKTIDRATKRQPKHRSLIMGKKGLDNLKKVLTYQDQFVAKPVYEQQLLEEVSDLRHEVCGLIKKNNILKLTRIKEREGEIDAGPLEQAIKKLKTERNNLKLDNNLLLENIQNLKKRKLAKYTIQEHEVMKGLTEATRAENKVLKKEFMLLKKEDEALQRKVLKWEMTQRESEKIRQENEELRAKVREIKREIVIKNAGYATHCLANNLCDIGAFERFKLREIARSLKAELERLPNWKEQLVEVKNNIAQDRQEACYLYEKIKEEQLLLEDSWAIHREVKYLKREETALKRHINTLSKDLNKARRERNEREALEIKIQRAGQNIDQLKSKKQALMQQLDLHCLMKTKEALKATMNSQSLESKEELTQIETLQEGLELPEPRPSTSAQ